MAGARIGAIVGGAPGGVLGLCIGGGLTLLGTLGVIIVNTRKNAEEAKKKAM